MIVYMGPATMLKGLGLRCLIENMDDCVFMGPATMLKGLRLRHKGLHWRSSAIVHKLAKIDQGL